MVVVVHILAVVTDKLRFEPFASVVVALVAIDIVEVFASAFEVTTSFARVVVVVDTTFVATLVVTLVTALAVDTVAVATMVVASKAEEANCTAKLEAELEEQRLMVCP